jgi:uncharacterized protein YdiU (UPF0061 family)
MEKLHEALEAYKVATNELTTLQEKLKPLQENAKELQKKIAEYEQEIDAEMQNIPNKKIGLWGFTVSYRKSSALKVFDETLLPAHFFVNVPKRLDAEIKKAIQNGEQVAGAEIEERENLQIKI